MASYQCVDCGKVTNKPRCDEHRAKGGHWSAGRDRTEQAHFRAEVLTRANNRCEHIEPNGGRCCVMGARNLVAHHVVPLAEGGRSELQNGRALCAAHHRFVDSKAR